MNRRLPRYFSGDSGLGGQSCFDQSAFGKFFRLVRGSCIGWMKAIWRVDTCSHVPLMEPEHTDPCKKNLLFLGTKTPWFPVVQFHPLEAPFTGLRCILTDKAYNPRGDCRYCSSCDGSLCTCHGWKCWTCLKQKVFSVKRSKKSPGESTVVEKTWADRGNLSGPWILV